MSERESSPIGATARRRGGIALLVVLVLLAAWGIALAGVGAGLAVPAGVIPALGFERSLALWNDEMGLLPWGLARILGITVHLDVPVSSAVYAAVAGVGVCVVGIVLALPWRARSR